MSVRVAAAFDALAMTAALERSAHGAAAAELHLFAYLACMIGFYDGDAPALWLYGFTATPGGAPYAHMLAEEVDRMRASGHLLDRGDLLVLSSVGASELAELRSFPSLRARASYVDAACATASLQPLPSIADALAQEPQLQEALGLNSSRELLTETGLLLLERHFTALKEALADRGPLPDDLLVPAAVWLGYLAAVARARVQEEIARLPSEEPG